ncbi:MAG: thermonuclease family protein [Candidatus Omnitrophota bacterium]
MRILFAIILIGLVALPAFAEIYTVKRVIGGDVLELDNGQEVRLIGIDCPESEPNEKAKSISHRTGKPLKNILKIGRKSLAFVKNLVEGKEVRLEFDVQKKNAQGRLLAYVYLREDASSKEYKLARVKDVVYDGRANNKNYVERFLNAYIIYSGYATPMNIPPNIKYMNLFEELYQNARKEKRGLWAD